MLDHSKPSDSIPKIAWLIWGLGAFFYFAQYAIRLVPSVIQAELTVTFEMSATSLGYLGGLFYYPYIAMQMPIGTLADRFGPRLLLTFGAFFCGLSALLFGWADSLVQIYLSRFLLGLFASAGFVCALKLATVWFPARMLGLIIGITQTFGMLGASSGGPLSMINQHYDYSTIMVVMGGVFILLSLASFMFVRNGQAPSTQSQAHSDDSNLNNILKTVLKSKYTWINAMYAGFIYAPVQVLGEYWGAQFFANVYGITPKQGAFAASTLFIGWIVGGPFAGMLADKIGRRPVMLISAFMCSLLFAFMFLMPTLSYPFVILLCFSLGVMNTGLIAAYTASGELHEAKCAGLSMAIANMFSIGFGAILIPLCGIFLDQVTSGAVSATGEPIYTAKEFLVSFSLLPLCALMALVCAFSMKETYQKT